MVESIGYDNASGVLEVEFKNNSQVWQYYDVPESVWLEIQSASSVGQYLNRYVKGSYREGRIG